MKIGTRTPIFAVVIHRGIYEAFSGMGGPIVQWDVASLDIGCHAQVYTLYLYRMFELVCASEQFMVPETYDNGPNLDTHMTEFVRIGECEVRLFNTQRQANICGAYRSAEIARDENRALIAPPEPRAWWMRWWPFGS